MKRLLLYSGATVAAVIVLAVLVIGSGYLYSLRLTAPLSASDKSDAWLVVRHCWELPKHKR